MWPGEIEPNLLLIDKPVGITSFDVIRELRRRTGIRKFGHAGTLDPAASGLLLLGVEAGTKRLSQLLKLDKVYEATILLGQSRTTGDQDGEVVEQAEEVNVTEDSLRAALLDLQGTHQLPVSIYSALKRDGVPLYRLTRQAIAGGTPLPEPPVRVMTVHQVTYQGCELYIETGNQLLLVRATFAVASGVYIRSLAEAFGRRLGYPACLYALRRTQVGTYHIADAARLEDFRSVT